MLSNERERKKERERERERKGRNFILTYFETIIAKRLFYNIRENIL